MCLSHIQCKKSIYPFVDINRWSKMTKWLMALWHSCLEICGVLLPVYSSTGSKTILIPVCYSDCLKHNSTHWVCIRQTWKSSPIIFWMDSPCLSEGVSYASVVRGYSSPSEHCSEYKICVVWNFRTLVGFCNDSWRGVHACVCVASGVVRRGCNSQLSHLTK